MGRLKGSKDGFYTTIKITCVFCKKIFDVCPGRHKTAKYCSRDCKNKDLIGKKHTLEHNKKIGLAGIGRKHSIETKQKMSISGKKRFSKNPMSKKTKNKLSKSHKAEKSYRWKGGRGRTTEGYILIYNPTHPFKNNNNYVLEHRLVMEKHIGRYLNPKEVVHHINGIVNDNRLENLMLFKNWVEHIAHHKSI